jgi:hypothetical protein
MYQVWAARALEPGLPGQWRQQEPRRRRRWQPVRRRRRLAVWQRWCFPAVQPGPPADHAGTCTHAQASMSVVVKLHDVHSISRCCLQQQQAADELVPRLLLCSPLEGGEQPSSWHAVMPAAALRLPSHPSPPAATEVAQQQRAASGQQTARRNLPSSCGRSPARRCEPCCLKHA